MNQIKFTTAYLLAIAVFLVGVMTIQTLALPTLRANGKIAFSRYRSEDSGIYLMNGDGSGQRQITNGAEDKYPTWSPDGRKIAFVRFSDNGGGWQINMMDADGTNIRQVIALDPTDFATYGLSWSPDGGKLAFDYSSDIYTINLDGTGRVNLTNGITAYEPSWSPDGTRIAFRGVAGFASNIFTMNVSGGDVRQITSNGDYFSGFYSPAYSPSGTQIVFSLALDDGNGSLAFNGLGLTNSDGTNQQLIPAPSFGATGSSKWSPDGTKLVFDNTGQIWTTNIDGSGLSQLTNPPSINQYPDWQPLPLAPVIATISGRVLTPTGAGLRNAIVSITDAAGNRRTATTSSFGFYTIDNISTGREYTIAVASKRYRFQPQTLSVTANITNFDFLGAD